MFSGAKGNVNDIGAWAGPASFATTGSDAAYPTDEAISGGLVEGDDVAETPKFYMAGTNSSLSLDAPKDIGVSTIFAAMQLENERNAERGPQNYAYLHAPAPLTGREMAATDHSDELIDGGMYAMGAKEERTPFTRGMRYGITNWDETSIYRRDISNIRLDRLAHFHWRLKLFYCHEADKIGSKTTPQHFETEVARLRDRMAQRTTDEQKAIAQEKAGQVRAMSNARVRLDNLARMLTEIGSEDSFAFNAVTTLTERHSSDCIGVLTSPRELNPYDVLDDFFRIDAHRLTDWEMNAKYNAIAYFKPEAIRKVVERLYRYFFEDNGERIEFIEHTEWSKVRENAKDPVLAVQVMDPDPKLLWGFTKGMLKKRPNNPIAVFDLYGNQFFPPPSTENEGT